MRFDVVSQDLKHVTSECKILKHWFVWIQLPIFRLQNDKYVVPDTDTAKQVNHFQNFIAKLVSKIMWILNFIF